MNELRWILLIAGALLIAGIYLWGLRSRQRSSVDAPRRPAVFSGGETTAFEKPVVAEDEPEATVTDASPGRRVEPSLVIDPDFESTPAIERRGAALPDDLAPSAPSAGQRREPTFGARAEPIVPARVEPALGPRTEPAKGIRPDPVAEPRRAAQPSQRPAVEEPAPAAAASDAAGAAASPSAPKPKRPQKIFAVRVQASGAARLEGERILEALEAEGLHFGRYDIFHRLHEDGRPVFSVASLKDPGTFDIKAMPGTQYPGVLVFTVLPGPLAAGDAFDEMLFTARALATHLGAALADDKGVPLTAHRAGRLREEALEFERTVAGAA